ncbi:MAG: low molecular weight protein arginine phosphatase [Clostridiales bacterium]|nr:low molecular weight protein arginine phosphatase [Clostridiales bacterium]
MKTVLFVCTGNTCRSPMAACMMNDLLAKAGREDIRAVSAGVAAFDGQPASPGAQHAMAKRGLSLADHRAQSVTQPLLNGCDHIFCMSPRHGAALAGAFALPVAVYSFSPAVSDPYGGSDAVYEACARELYEHLTGLLPLLTADAEKNS